MKEINFQEKVGIYSWFKKKTQIWAWLSLTKSVNLANFMHLVENLKKGGGVRKEKLIFSIIALIIFDSKFMINEIKLSFWQVLHTALHICFAYLYFAFL